MKLQDKVALVTGAASGIGEGIVRRYVEDGATVYLSDVDSISGERIASEIGGAFLKLDVTSEIDWSAAIDRIGSDHGRLNVLVNNAGIVSNASIYDMTLDMWNRVMAVNVTGAMLGCRTAIQIMRHLPKGTTGSIINMASTVSFLGLANDAVYTSSKAAIVGLTRSIATWCALEKLPIRVNTLHPGTTHTAILQSYIDTNPDMKNTFDRMSPMGRMARPDEQAALASFLASDDSSYCTGAAFFADGGLTAAHPVM